MEHSSEEEYELSDSEIDEYKDTIYAQLRAGKLKVRYGERTFRCPFCLGKKKQDYNGKDLLQHASGIGAAPKRKAEVRAAHLALAEFVKNDLASSLEPSLQLAIVECKPPKKEEEKFVWPWMGILVNVPTDLKCAISVRESEDRLRSQLSRFRPCQVIVKLDSSGQIDHSIIKFSEDWTGLEDALAFEKHFVVEKYSKTDWNKINCRKDDLYGWLARSVDYNSPGTIGEHLRNIGILQSISDRERKGTDRRVISHFCHNWGTFILLTWMPTYYNQVLKFNLTESGLLCVLPWLTMAVFANIGGWIADTLVAKGVSVTNVRKIMQSIGFLGPALFLTLLSKVRTPAMAVLCMACSQGSDAFSQSGLYSNHQDIGPRYAGVLLGLSNTAGVLAGVFGTAATGYILQKGSWDNVFQVSVILYIVGTVVWNVFSTGERILE